MGLTNDILVTIGGDFCPVGRPQSGLLEGSLSEQDIVGSLRDLFAGSDFGIVNLECSLSQQDNPISKSGPLVRADQRMIRLLTHLGVKGTTLANNHIRDYDSKGVLDTLDVCLANGIRTVGAGAAMAQARRPLVMTLKGRRVAFVNVAEQEFGSATSTRAGANPLDLIQLLRDLRLVKTQADHVILIVHGGLEMVHVPSPESVRLLRFLADQGVTAVIRHHSHVTQGYEVWQGVPIFYGLGNMLFDLDTRMPEGWYNGLLVTLRLSAQGVCSFDLHPILQCDGSPSVQLLQGDAKAEALRRIEGISALLADSEALSSAWAEAIRPMRDYYLGLLGVPFWVLRRALVRLNLMRHFHPSLPVAMCWENLLRCETHREVLLDLLKKEPSPAARTEAR